MATSDKLYSVTMEAGADLSAKQYYFVTLAADGQVDPTGDGLRADGVLQNAPGAAGYPATIGVEGISIVVAGAAITRGDKVTSDASGKAKTATSGNAVNGIAMEAALADGDWISVNLKVQGVPNA